MNQLRPGLLFIFLLLFSKVYAQKSLLDDVSVPYLDTLIKIAKENYPRIKALDQEITVAQNTVNRAKISYLDLLGIYYFYTPQRTNSNIENPYFLNGFQVGFSFNIGTFLQKPYTVKISKNQLSIAKFQKDEYGLNLEANVKNRYYNYIQRVSIVKLRSQAVLDAQSSLSFIRNRFERGQETLDNYNRTLADLNTQNREKIIAESEMLSAKAFLEELLNKKLEEINAGG